MKMVDEKPVKIFKSNKITHYEIFYSFCFKIIWFEFTFKMWTIVYSILVGCVVSKGCCYTYMWVWFIYYSLYLKKTIP